MRGNLPAEVSSFIGRSAEVRQIRKLLERSRLVSLTGVGGVGKTRLARAVAADARRAFRDGVWLLDLTPHSDGALIERSLRDLLPGSETARTLQAQIGERSLLIILDNCEHVASTVAGLLDSWLQQCPAVRVLTTTRTTLRVSGEQVFEVTPLSLPMAGAPPLSSEAVELFKERVLALDANSSIDFASPTIAELCRKLEGLPLAIELAALQTRVLSIEELIEGLEARFDLLTDGPVNFPRHHQSLRALLQWSWERSSTGERQIWTGFSVFAGSATLPDLAAVCNLDQQKAVRFVDSLIRNSVVQRSDVAGVPRFHMLDTIREFGTLMLRTQNTNRPEWEAGNDAALRARHSSHYLGRVRDATARWFGPEQPAIVAWTNAEMENIRLALETAIGDALVYDAAAEGVADLWFYWVGCGHLDEGRFWADSVVKRFESVGRALPQRLLWVRGWIHLVAGDVATARRDLIASLTASALHGDDRNVAYARAFLGALHGFAENRLIFDNEYARAVGMARDCGDTLAEAMFLVHQAEICSLTGQPEEAERLCDDSERLCQSHGDHWCMGYVLWVRALCSLVRGERQEAAAFAQQAAMLMVEVDDHLGAVLVSEVAAWALSEDDPAHAMTILSATEHYWNMSGRALLGFGRLMAYREAALRAIACELSSDQASRYSAAGQALGESGARSIVMATFGDHDRLEQRLHPSASGEEVSRLSNPLERLSPRERQVAYLVARGLTNQEIADDLVIGRRTVDTHVSNILNKCGLRGRTEIAVLVSNVTTSQEA